MTQSRALLSAVWLVTDILIGVFCFHSSIPLFLSILEGEGAGTHSQMSASQQQPQLRHLPRSAAVERGVTVFLLADECIKEYAVRANEMRSQFDVVHQTSTLPAALLKELLASTSNNAAGESASAPGCTSSGRGLAPITAGSVAPYWVAVKTPNREAFEVQLATLRDPSGSRKRRRDATDAEGDAALSASSQSGDGEDE
jgi:hypothetical protein